MTTSVGTISRHTLDNGLRLVVARAGAQRVAAVNLWYGVGSRHERAGRTGFAHLFEHLMFQGTAHTGKGEHLDQIERLGGDLNASTWTERTNYFETVPEHGLDLALWLEADRLATLREGVTQEVLDNQRDVVKNERRQRYDNVPYGTAYERLLAMGYPEGHPYHHSTIGSMADLDAATLDDVLTFHEHHYGPDNAVLTVVTDLDPDDVLRRVEAQFGRIAPRSFVPETPDPTLESLMTGGPGTEVVVENCPAPAVHVAYRVPGLGAHEHDVAEVTAALLGLGQGSRLYRRLVLDRRLAVDDGGSAGDLLPFHYAPALALFGLVARDGVSGETLEAALIEEVERVAKGVEADEVARAQAVLERDHAQSISSPTGRADEMSRFTTLFDDPGLALSWPERWATVTPDEVVAFAESALTGENRVVLRFEPEEAQA